MSEVELPRFPNECALVAPEDWLPSCNFEPRNNDGTIDLLLLHYTATSTTEHALELLTTKEGGVSSHYLIDEDGRILQLVAERERAWHAGEAVWDGEVDVNSCSIGIEIQNQGAALAVLPPYGARQMAAVVALCQDIVARHNIPAHRVLGHSDVAPHRKQDPGAHFDWARLARAGVGLWVEADGFAPGPCLALSYAEMKGFQEKLQTFGYGLQVTGEHDERCRLVVTALQRHFRPERVDGEIDEHTLKVLDLLLCKMKA